jgi:hypothetical protein
LPAWLATRERCDGSGTAFQQNTRRHRETPFERPIAVGAKRHA